MDKTTQHIIKIGFDAKRANANNTGLGSYSRFIIDGLASLRPDLELRMYLPKRRANRAYDALLKYPQVSEALPRGSWWRMASSLWRTLRMAADAQHDNVDIFHGLSAELPGGLHKRGIKSVVTIHDLIFLRYPKFYKPIDRFIYERKFRYACCKADHIVAVSECTKRDIINYFGTDPAKIEVIYQGCAPEFGASISEEQMLRVKQEYALPSHFMLNVGSIESRKNLMLVVKSLAHLPEDMHLVAVGRKTQYSDDVVRYATATGVAHRLHILSDVPFHDLPVLYRLAEIFVYPSYFEGFGIPIVEAANSGIPIIAATGSCLEEAGGDSCIYVSPDNAQALAEAVQRITNDDTLRGQMVARSYEYVKRFKKEVVAAQIADLYERMIYKQ